jgi:aspartate aminotransferase
MELAARTARIAMSPTMKVTADALKLKAQGVDIVDFAPESRTFRRRRPHRRRRAPRHRRQFHQVHEQLRHRGSSSGAIVERYRLDNGVDYTPSEVICPAGGKQALFNSVLALFGPGDEVDHAHAGLADAWSSRSSSAEATPVIVRSQPEERLRAARGRRPSARSRRARAAIISTRPTTPPAR